MAYQPPSQPGQQHPAIPAAKVILEARYSSYAAGVNDGSPFYTVRFGEVLREFGRRVNDDIAKNKRPGPKIPTPGVFDWATQVQLGIIARAAGTPTPAQPAPPAKLTDTWLLSAPGSGVPWNVGPPFELGEIMLRENGVHHLPLGYQIGGYMGFMGGDSKDSYLDIIRYCDVENERRIREDILPKYGIHLLPGEVITAEQVKRLPAKFKLVLVGYSQSAEALIRSAARLFGDGGVFELLRPFLKAVIAFGNPVRVGGATRYGRTPPGSGISDWRPPAWLAALVIDIVNEGPGAPDFYACTTSRIAKLAYGVIVRAETELPFVMFLAKIVIPAMLNLLTMGLAGGAFGGLFGGLLGNTAAIPLLGGATGLSGNALTPLMGMAQADIDPAGDAIIRQIVDMLTPLGLLGSLPELIGLLIGLQGIAVHGDYFAPKPEFGNRNGVQVAIDQLRPIV